ncbi:unnamed protein product [Timema podura]|uniref:Large ribosomal subunit protein uL10-like insertion domain-containing protein n=1 Tax=Timema podura TaxID=61482 RepID=A0ABN7PGK6_TIMPD|nr:unnamed protein product [Timema podura]
MPKSKRDKKVSLTKVTKKVGLQLKQKFIEDIQKYVGDYNSVESEVLEWFKNYSRQDFARSGTIAEDTLVLNEGPLTQFPGSLEPRLRQLGLPTQLKGGVVSLLQDVTVCTEGKVIMPEQARILRLLGRETSRFTLSVQCRWGKDGNFKIYKEADKDMETENIQEN